MTWQPTLESPRLLLRPLREDDFGALFSVGSDPLLWELHPERDRWQPEKFRAFFQSGIESGGGMAVVSKTTGKIIGTSRFTNHEPEKGSVEVGYTFLTREHWGRGYNRELKELMLDHAFGLVESIFFFVGDCNLRSQRAMLKLGATEVERIPRAPAQGNPYASVVFRILKEEWREISSARRPSK